MANTPGENGFAFGLLYALELQAAQRGPGGRRTSGPLTTHRAWL
ncbi:hypothetical protein ACFVKB_32505 [Rhodococcus sp. NPDC127530]